MMAMLKVVTFLVMLFVPQVAAAWGEKGHFMVNRLAIGSAGPVLPPFTQADRVQLVYNAYEPDRWRDEAGSAMNTAQALDHFFDSEMWGPISTIESERYAFMAKLVERKTDLAKVGYLPYAILENYGRLRNAFRRYRNAPSPQDRESARLNAVNYAGVLGHYVGDSTMPMHLSIHFNGWADGTANPRNFTTDRMFHSRYEDRYVNVAVEEGRVQSLVRPPERLYDVFAAVKDYLGQTFSQLEPMYEMEKAGEFNPDSPRPDGTAFITAQLARASTMLASLWYTAWVESGEPVQPGR
jgi:hypothetical protein